MNIIADLTDNLHAAIDAHPLAMVGLMMIVIIFVACAFTAREA